MPSERAAVDPGRAGRTRVPLLRRVGMGLATTALFLLGAEGALRLFVPKDRLLFSWERPDGMLNLAPSGTYVPRPGHTETQHDGPYTWTAKHNTQGVREDHEIPARGGPGVTRILALGDSWIYGWSVDQPETIPENLERRLEAARGGEVEVINGGVHGSCGFDMYVRWRQLAPQFEVDGVLLGSPHNVGNEADRSEERRRWLAERPALPTSDTRIYLLLRRSVLSRVMPRASALDAHAGAGVLDQAATDVLRIADEARAMGKAVWFLAFPTNLEAATAPTGAGDIQATWFRVMRAKGVPVTGHTLKERACWGFVDTAHPSVAGARVLAQLAADLITTGQGPAAASDQPPCTPAEAPAP